MGGLANYLRYMADLLPRTTSATERDRIQRAVDQGFRNVAYHSTNEPWNEIDLNYADIGLHAGTPTQAANRALDKAIAAGVQARRGHGRYLPETNIIPLAYRIGDTLKMPDVGEWKDSVQTLLALRKHPELAGIKGNLNDLLEYVEPERQAYYDKADWMYDPTNLAVLQDARGLLLDLGYKQIEYPNAVENSGFNYADMMQSAWDQLEGIKSKAMSIYKLGEARYPTAPDVGATEADIQKYKAAGDVLSFLAPEERALYDKYRDEAYAVREDPASYDNPNSLIFLDPADVRSINAQFAPGREWEAGLFKADGGPVKMGRGGLTRLADEAAEKAQKQAEVERVRPTVYHGTQREIEGGKLSDPNSRGAVFVTENPDEAAKYAMNDLSYTGTSEEIERYATGAPFHQIPEGAAIYRYKADLKNTFDPQNPDHVRMLANSLGGQRTKAAKMLMENLAASGAENNWGTIERHLPQIKDLGFDSVRVTERGAENIAVFDSDVLEPFEQGGPVKMGRGGLTRLASEAAEKAREQAAEVLPEAERKANLERFMAGSHAVDEQGQPRVMYHATYAQPEFDEFNRLASVQNYRRKPSMDTIGTWVTSNPGKGGAEMYGSGQGAYTMPLYVNPKKTKTYETFDDYLQDMHAARGSSLERVRAEGKPAGLGSTEELRQKLIEEGYDSIGFARTNWEELKSMAENLTHRLELLQKEMGSEWRRLEGLGYKRVDRKWKETMQPLLSEEQRLKESIFATQNQMERRGGEFDDQDVLVMLHPEQIKSAIGNVGTYDPANPVITKKDGGPVYDPARISQMVDQLMGKPMAEGGPVKMQEGGRPEYAGAFDELVAAERAARLREAGTPLERYAYETLGMEPGLDRAAFLPYATAEGGRKEFAVPGLLYDAIKYGLAPGAAALGTPVSVEDAMGLASNVMGGGLGVSSPVDGAVAGMAIKQKGGNWLDGAIEDVMKPLRSKGVGEADRAWFEARAAENPDEYQMALQTIPRTEAINRWIDQKLAKYIRNEMATPEDPVLMQVDQFPAQKAEALAAKDAQIAKATADMERNRERRGFTPEMMTRAQAEIRELQRERAFIEAQTGLHARPRRYSLGQRSMAEIEDIRFRAGLPVEGFAKTGLGREWESLADSRIAARPAGNYLDAWFSDDDLYEVRRVKAENPWLEKVPPNTPVYETRFGMPGASHIMDELKNAIRLDTDLPPELRITPETLNKMNVAQAVRLVDKINAWRSVQKAEADLAIASNAATVPYRTYDTIPGTDQPNARGLRWVQLRTPEDPSADPEALAKALKYEGNMLQHCVGGYCRDVEAGRSLIYSLRDAEGRPYTTIEVEPGAQIPLRPEDNPPLDQYAEMQKWFNDGGRDSPLTFAQYWRAKQGIPEPDRGMLITQIKGKQNLAPAAEYLPFVQDFVQSGNWSGVGDFANTGLRDLERTPNLKKWLQSKNIVTPRYLTEQQYAKYESDFLAEQLGLKNGGPVQMKDGGDPEMNAPDVTLGYLLRKYGPEFLTDPLDELAELRGAYNAGLDTQIAPDEGGLPGLALATMSLPEVVPALTTLAGAGLTYIDPETGLGVIDAGSDMAEALPESIAGYSSRYDEHLNRMLEKYGLPESGQLDALDRFALAAGEMTGQLPMPGAWLNKLKTLKRVPKAVPLLAEYFGPTVDPKLANYVVGTGVGGGLRQLDGASEPERARDTLTYTPPSFPGMAEGGAVKMGRGRLTSLAAESALRRLIENPLETEAQRMAQAIPTPVNKNFVRRYLNPDAFPVIRNPDGSVSSHRMASAETGGRYVAYPTIVQDSSGRLRELGEDEAFRYAMANNEFLEFPTERAAQAYADSGYKQETPMESAPLTQFERARRDNASATAKAKGGPVYDQARIDAMVDSLMAPKMAQGGPVARFARGGLGRSADEAARRAKDASMARDAEGAQQVMRDEAVSVAERANAGRLASAIKKTNAIPTEVRMEEMQFDPRFDPRVNEQQRIRDSVFRYLETPIGTIPEVSIFDFEGMPFIIGQSDRSAANRQLMGIDDVEFETPVIQQGGQDFMFSNPGQVWASAPQVVSAVMNRAKPFTQNPLLFPYRMAPTGGDFATMTGEAMMEYAKNAMNKKTLRSLDASLRKALPEFSGVTSTLAREQFRRAGADVRNQILDIMDKNFRNKGGINIGQARLATTDPRQFIGGDTGLMNVGLIEREAPVITNSGHLTYQAGIPGGGLGALKEKNLYAFDLLPDVAQQRNINPLNPTPEDKYTLSRIDTRGIITDKLLKRIQQILAERNGRAGGGLISNNDMSPEEQQVMQSVMDAIMTTADSIGADPVVLLNAAMNPEIE